MTWPNFQIFYNFVTFLSQICAVKCKSILNFIPLDKQGMQVQGHSWPLLQYQLLSHEPCIQGLRRWLWLRRMRWRCWHNRLQWHLCSSCGWTCYKIQGLRVLQFQLHKRRRSGYLHQSSIQSASTFPNQGWRGTSIPPLIQAKSKLWRRECLGCNRGTLQKTKWSVKLVGQIM